MEFFAALALLVLGYFTGSWLERKHYADIERRERALIHQPAVPADIVDEPLESLGVASGSVVISVDYFKRFAAGLRNLIGGNVGAYETLMDRARREAVLRMKESCPQAHLFLNVRMETAMIGSQYGQGTVCVEVCAYGTAVKRRGA
jgi:uncharacterized protein YbjQ (UPF0145 family)